MSLKEELSKNEGFQEYLSQYPGAGEEEVNHLTNELAGLINHKEISERGGKFLKSAGTTLLLGAGTYVAKTLGLDDVWWSSFYVGSALTGIAGVLSFYNFREVRAVKMHYFQETVQKIAHLTAKDLLEEKYQD